MLTLPVDASNPFTIHPKHLVSISVSPMCMVSSYIWWSRRWVLSPSCSMFAVW